MTDFREGLTRRYIADVADDIAARIERDLGEGLDPTPMRLAEDVAWLARSLSRLAALPPAFPLAQKDRQ